MYPVMENNQMRIYGQEIKPKNQIVTAIKNAAIKAGIKNAPLGMIPDPIYFANIAACRSFSKKILGAKDTFDRLAVMITEPKSSPIATLVNKACRLIGRK